MTTYVLNVPVLTAYGKYSFKPLKVDEANAILVQGFVSAVGHEGTASFMSKILGIQIPFNRIAVAMKSGDKAIIFRLLQRLPEGVVLSEQELAKIPYELALLTKESEES